MALSDQLKDSLLSRLAGLSPVPTFVPPGWEVWFVGETVDINFAETLNTALVPDSKCMLCEFTPTHKLHLWKNSIGGGTHGLMEACPGIIFLSCKRGFAASKEYFDAVEKLAQMCPPNSVYTPSLVILFKNEEIPDMTEQDVKVNISHRLHLKSYRLYFLDMEILFFSDDGEVVTPLVTLIKSLNLHAYPQPDGGRSFSAVHSTLFSLSNSYAKNICGVLSPSAAPAAHLNSLRLSVASLNLIGRLLKAIVVPERRDPIPLLPEIEPLGGETEAQTNSFHVLHYLCELCSTSSFPHAQKATAELRRRAQRNEALPVQLIYETIAADYKALLRPVCTLHLGSATSMTEEAVIEKYRGLLAEVDGVSMNLEDQVADIAREGVNKVGKRERGPTMDGKLLNPIPSKRARLTTLAAGPAPTIPARSAAILEGKFSNFRKHMLSEPGI